MSQRRWQRPAPQSEMLFNSWLFILVFLPVFLSCWQYLAPQNAGGAKIRQLIFLGFSLVFYLFWGWQYFLLLLAITACSYLFGQAIARSRTRKKARKLLCLAIIANLLPLLWFKYFFFLIENISLAFSISLRFTPPGLPLGISFYTFIQIAWLVGIYRKEFAPGSLHDHASFSCGFPWVISGPIIRYGQTSPQLEHAVPLAPETLARGLTLFCLGLGKKALLADSLGFYADAVFAAAEKNWPLTAPEAWLGSLAYTFQLYFDFSGYTDMALGLGLMIGLNLPENFNSPYKATGIMDFWRRWHITLGSWLRDFLYIPLGGNRKGKLRQHLNLFLTMLIAGAWHGAGWTFILWGAAQGLMLSINHFFRARVAGCRLESYLSTLPARIFFIGLTFLLINLCWVVFRAFSLDGALAMLRTMAGLGQDTGWFTNRYFTGWLPFALIGASAAICWLFPTSSAILSSKTRFIAWKPTPAWSVSIALLFFISLVMLGRQTTFLYFQF